MRRWIVPTVLLAAFCGHAYTEAADDDLAKVAASCPAAAAWIKAHRGAPQPAANENGQAPSQPALRIELQQRAGRDQQARAAWVAAGLRVDSKEAEATRQVDASNTAWLKGVIARSGFPTPQQVGNQGVSDAWLLVQHADADPRFSPACWTCWNRACAMAASGGRMSPC